MKKCKGLCSMSLVVMLLMLTAKVTLYAQAPGGVTSGLKTWYKADAVSGKSNGDDLASWSDQYTADGAAQHAVQNPLNTHPFFGNRQPQFRTSVSKYNYNPYLDFSKYFAGFMAYQAHSTTPDYQLNYTKGATLYQVADLSNNQGFYFGSGLGQSTPLYSGYRYNYGMPWWGINQQYYGTAVGYYQNTVDDYFWPQTPNSNDYNWLRAKRKTQNNIPYISSISYDKYNTVYSAPNNVVVNGNDAATAIQTRVNGDKWNWRYSFTAPGSSLWIGNEYANYNAGRWWKGGMSEVILYDRKLNTAAGGEADRVDSYLALKYGITLTHSYFLSDGTKAWDSACNKVYNKEIAGIVRDDASALYQKQSHSILKKTILSMSLGDINETSNAANSSTIGTDKYSMVWGSNGSAGTSQDKRDIPGGYTTLTTQMGAQACFTDIQAAWSQKKWQVQEQTGKDVGTVKVYIESKDMLAIDWTCPAFIVVGTDANFSNPKYYALSLATGTASATDYVTDINFCEGASNASTTCGSNKSQYFAVVGKGAVRFPGGVTGGLKFWVRADMGALNDADNKIDAVAGESSRVREWVNQVKGPSALPYYAVPTLQTASRYNNFNPIVDFAANGTEVLLTAPIGGANENKQSNTARMVASNVLSQTGYQADSLVMFSSHRNIDDYYNATIGIGYAGNLPGLFHDANYRNGAEYYSNSVIDHTTDAVAGAPNYRPAFTTPYNGSGVLWSPGAPASSSFGRTYSTALYWYPANPLNVGSATSVAHQLRANGKYVRLAGTVNIDSPYRVANLPALGMGAYTNNAYYKRNDVALAGGQTDYTGAAIHDAILYNRGMKAAELETERIETYLGIRSGISMQHNYYATDKTLLWDTTNFVDAAPNVTGYTRYNRSITGIGRDDLEGLHQRVSRNAEDTVITISLGVIPQDEDQASVDADFANDKEYILWGSNGGAMNARITTDLPTVLPGCIDSRVNREYRVHLKGATGGYKTQVRWQLDNNLLDNVNGTSLSLLIDDDGDGNFATGTYRVIPATSYDAATNSAIFDNVTWSTAGDTNPSDAAMTIVWSQVTVGRAKLYNNTANGGACPNGNCPTAAEVLNPICNDASGWTFYQDNDNNRKTVAINWGANTGTKTVSVDVSATNTARRKAQLNVTTDTSRTDYAATVGARMVNVNYTGTLTEPVKIRFYYDDVQTTGEIDRDSTWIKDTSGVNEPNLVDSTWTWFKFEGNPTQVLSSLTHLGLPAGNGTEALTATSLQPDEMGTEDGVKYVQFNYITSFSTIGYVQTYQKSSVLVALPLNLLDFSASKQSGKVSLQWLTANETGVKGFDIQRSTDGRTFTSIGFVAGRNQTSGLQQYAYDDVVTDVKSEKVFYRLKMIDLDGKSTYSPIRFVVIDNNKWTVRVAPNPFGSQLTAQVYSPSASKVQASIYSVDGKLLLSRLVQLQPGDNRLEINTSSIAAGTYRLKLRYDNGAETNELVLKNQ